jgi:bifunctional non-homologous end joining protein LigD
MLAKTGEAFDSRDYLFEPKWDGLRALLFRDGSKLELQNRNLRDATGSYPEIQETRQQIKSKKAIIDGEIVVLGKRGVPDFGRLQSRFGLNDRGRIDIVRGTNPATYVAFDLLHIDGKDILAVPVEERKRRLLDILTEGPHLIYSEHVQETGVKYYSKALRLGFEGIIAKERSSRYTPGTRSSLWIKIKGTRTMDCIVTGFTAGEGARASTFGSLVMAAYDKNGQLVHVGNVGGGFNQSALESIKHRLGRLVRKVPVLEGPIEAPAPITWVKPSLVCELRYANITADKKLRFPRFLRLRTDMKPEDCRLEEGILST